MSELVNQAMISVNEERQMLVLKNERLYDTAQYLLKASETIIPLSKNLASTYAELAEMLLMEIDIETKMDKTEMDDVMADILGS